MNRRLIRVRLWLLNSNLTQAEVARRLGLSKQYVHEVLAGTKRAEQIRKRLVAEIGIPADLVEIQPPNDPQELAA